MLAGAFCRGELVEILGSEEKVKKMSATVLNKGKEEPLNRSDKWAIQGG